MNRVVPEAPGQEFKRFPQPERRTHLPESNLRRKTPSLRSVFSSQERRALGNLLRWAGNPPIAVDLYGNDVLVPPNMLPIAQVLIRDRNTLWKLATDPLYEFGEAYSTGKVEVQGDLTKLLSLVFQSCAAHRRDCSPVARIMRILRRPRPTSLSRARDNIAHHYNI
jgi:cyclopropane-fatty-acyl-phospholipid synthase